MIIDEDVASATKAWIKYCKGEGSRFAVLCEASGKGDCECVGLFW